MKIRFTFDIETVDLPESTLDEYLLEHYDAGTVAAATPEMKVALLNECDALQELARDWVPCPDVFSCTLEQS